MVKTMEAPRDLQLADRITQYAPLEGDLEKTAEIIFLVRPDFVIFDEVRRARDFEIFADVRLAGVGLLGVTHANSALEAIQRLIGKVELGLVSQVLEFLVQQYSLHRFRSSLRGLVVEYILVLFSLYLNIQN